MFRARHSSRAQAEQIRKQAKMRRSRDKGHDTASRGAPAHGGDGGEGAEEEGCDVGGGGHGDAHAAVLERAAEALARVEAAVPLVHLLQRPHLHARTPNRSAGCARSRQPDQHAAVANSQQIITDKQKKKKN